MIWSCPVCSSPLMMDGKTSRCENNHEFDRAKQGYFNLLLANQKKSQDPGDTRDMLLSRRNFLEQGFYSPLVEALKTELSQTFQRRSNDSLNILDAGCGEGYYLDQFQQVFSGQLKTYGIDISREAAKLAARAYPESEWAVASAFRLPVLDDSVDILLRNFAPGDNREMQRVLNHRGELWRIAPGPLHLSELKAHLYDEALEHESPKPIEEMTCIQTRSITFSVTLNSRESVGSLLAMTPFVWTASPQKRQAIETLEQLSVTADFVFERFSTTSS